MYPGRQHIWIPDTQCGPEDNFDHLEAAGNYICDKRPDVIVDLGDHWDFASLSSYDKGKKRAEGKRVSLDIEAGKEAMRRLLAPLRALQAHQRHHSKKVYKPEMHFLYGNHEDRLVRYCEDNPAIDGFLTLDSLGVNDFGWIGHGFKEVLELDGIQFSHYFYNPDNGRPYGGMVESRLKNIGNSFVQGHQQGLRVGTKALSGGRTQRGVVAGSFYQHDEHYRGPQAKYEWRGILYATEVRNGNFNLCEVSLDYLLDKWL